MNGVIDENQLIIVMEYEFDKPLFQKRDSLIDNSIRDCHDSDFHTFDHLCEYNLNFTNTINNETVNFTISDNCMGMYELNQKLATVRGNGFIFNQIKKFKIKIHSNLSNINIHYHLKLSLPPLHRQFFIKISQNCDYIQTFCNDRKTPLHVANGILIIIHNDVVVYLHVFEYKY